jgi:hypothetical protein
MSSVKRVRFYFADEQYLATSDGRVFKKDGTELSYQKDGDKLRISLKNVALHSKVGLHRLIAICFLGATKNDEVVHKDGNGHNNAVENLELKRLDREVSKFGDSINVIDTRIETVAAEIAPRVIEDEASVEPAVETIKPKIKAAKAVKSVVDQVVATVEQVMVSNGYGKFMVSVIDFENVPYYKKHGFKIVK